MPNEELTAAELEAIRKRGLILGPHRLEVLGRSYGVASPPDGSFRVPLRHETDTSLTLEYALGKMQLRDVRGLDVAGFVAAFAREMAARGYDLFESSAQSLQPFLSGYGPLFAFRIEEGIGSGRDYDVPARQSIEFDVDCRLNPAIAASIVDKNIKKIRQVVRDYGPTRDARPGWIQRSAVIAGANLLRDPDKLERLLVQPPSWRWHRSMRINENCGVSIRWNTFHQQTAPDGNETTSTDGDYFQDSDQGVLAWVKSTDLRWKGNTLIPGKGLAIPECACVSGIGMQVDCIVSHPALDDSGLVVDRLWHSGGHGRNLRLGLKGDLLDTDQARELGWRTIERIRKFGMPGQ